MYWISKSIHKLNRFRRQLIVFLSVLGPGIIVMIADNDAGGISTYAVTGSKYGFTVTLDIHSAYTYGLLCPRNDGSPGGSN